MFTLTEVDQQLQAESYLWCALRRRGRDQRLQERLMANIDDLLDLRLDVMQDTRKSTTDNECDQAFPQ